MKNKTYDITALGELLMDMTPNGLSDQGNPLFEANIGGAPCNVLSMAARLGSKCAFIGKVGNDTFGNTMINTVSSMGIDVSGVYRDCDIPTTLALVTLDETGDRSFAFYRSPGADVMLTEDEVSADIIASSKIFHFGTLSMTAEPVKSATKAAVNTALKSKSVISFDPNIRMSLWKNETDLRAAMAYGFSKCHILKISDDELKYYTGLELEEGADKLASEFTNIKIMFITCGKDGCMVKFGGKYVSVPTFTDMPVVDTTGAGDSFMGTCLHYLADENLDDITEDDIRDVALCANAAASIVVGRRGALLSMPTFEEMEKLLD